MDWGICVIKSGSIEMYITSQYKLGSGFLLDKDLTGLVSCYVNAKLIDF